jgi:glycosyltransferase involved in cell wall biosynthesis
VKVAISVMGRFHAFDLAAQLERRGHLAQLITSYPKSEVAKFGIPRQRVTSILRSELLRRGYGRLPGPLRARVDLRGFLHRHYGRRAARRLRPGPDLFVGWSGSALPAIRRARELGMLTVVERGSSHVLAVRELLLEEYGRHGLVPQVTHPEVVEWELAEYEEADYVAVPSGFAKRTFLERGVPESRLLHLPLGVSLSQFAPAAEESDGVFRVMHCGRVDLRKGCHHLLEAFCELALPDAELWFVGDVAPEMERFRRRFASRAVVFHGPVPQADLPRYYARASVFCLASVEDGFGMVIPQAMACGLPVVATTNTAAEDVIRDGVDGFIVTIRAPEALAAAIRVFHDDPERRAAMGRAARERVSKGFSWDDYGERVVASYRRALEAR